MRAETPSRTAAWVAAARGMGMLLPDDARLADDPYGIAFTSRRLKRLVDGARERGPSGVATMPGVGEWVLYMQVRTRVLDDAVRDFAAYSAPRSVLAMTYFGRARIARPRPMVRAIAVVVSRAGEPWRWGWPPAELPGWLAARGFTLERDVGMDAAARELLPAALAQRVGDPESRVALALRESVALASSRGLS